MENYNILQYEHIVTRGIQAIQAIVESLFCLFCLLCVLVGLSQSIINNNNNL